jgi:hypothetical protein
MTELPKGMVIKKENVVDPTPPPEPLSMETGNYGGAILQTLKKVLPFEIRVDRFVVTEEDGRPPKAEIILTVLDEKGGDKFGR